ncbi:MAG TPA: hypothetical protein PK413_00380 [Thermoanaerobaculia bacterium]|nr:hypothetical protein [Thermoanaerobaculia bacterium]
MNRPPASPAKSQAYPPEIEGREARLVGQRRRAAGVASADGPPVGVALSGGGIRSATFCLGVFQALARRKLLRRMDFLSTVSGGGYFGSFFTAFFARQAIDGQKVAGPGDVEEVLLGQRCPRRLRYLRENGRYLSPSGSGDLLLGGAVLLRNWVAIHLVLLTSLLAGFLAAQAVRFSLPQAWLGWISNLDNGWIWWSPWMVVPLAIFLLVAFPAGWAYWAITPRRSPGRWEGIHPLVGVGLVTAAGYLLARSRAAGTELATGGPVHWDFVGHAGLLLGGLTVLYWALAMLFAGRRLETPADRDAARRSWLSQLLKTALVATAGTLVFALIDSLGQTLYYLAASRDPMLGSNWGKLATGLTAAVTGIAAFGRRIVVLFSKGDRDSRPSLPLNLFATVAAVLLLGLVLVGVATLSHGLAWNFQPPSAKFLPGRLQEPRPADSPDTAAPLKLTLTGGKLELPQGVDGPSPEGQKASVELDFEGQRAVAPRHAEAAPSFEPRRSRPLWWGLGLATLLALLFGQTYPFLNRSSQHALYAARLTRAYLGASNPGRRGDEPLSRVVQGDDLSLPQYFADGPATGGPLHLINVTLNETVDGRSNIQQQDRKGSGLAIGPAGMSLGVRHHLEVDWTDGGGPRAGAQFGASEEGFQVFAQPVGPLRSEALTLGQWVAISGAAFSTGTGFRTSLGLSLLAGIGNVRLGYWWRHGNRRPPRPLLERLCYWLGSVQTYLANEFLARFPGTARGRWYLSDGGHFENMGGYELVRRRLPRMVVLDAEADADYTFDGLANLVRKARIDFGAEIRFLSAAELDDAFGKASAGDRSSLRACFGTLEDLRRGTRSEEGSGAVTDPDPRRLSLAHAALAEVIYEDEAPARGTPAEQLVEGTGHWLLYLKPTLCGREPSDVLEYHRQHPAFPHESTGDQFFDEAQWESYRKLGEFIGEELFGGRRAVPAGKLTAAAFFS